ncbi:SMI1/KNR4 family protein [Vibrio sp. Hal054]|uniref:SMI1/KNR4 family protein n=1 Tax=Vibrio sp. Hal054 TaxID=3035158 RepID=UPI00301E58B5
MLEEIIKQLMVKAPKIATAFLEPATAEEVQLLSLNVVGELPQPLIELYKSSKGQDPNKVANFAYGVTWITISQTTDLVESYTEAGDGNELRYADVGIDKSYTLGKKRVPIADDFGTCLICVDLGPSEEGDYGQVILVDQENNVALKLASSVTELLSNFEKDLASNMYALSEDALEDGEHWLTPERAIDPVNWFNSPTWHYVVDKLSA